MEDSVGGVGESGESALQGKGAMGCLSHLMVP